MPALPPTPSILSPKVTSSLANTEVLAPGLKKLTPAETSPHTSWRLSSRWKLVPVAALKAETAKLGAPKVQGSDLYFGTTKASTDVVDAVVKKQGGAATLFVKSGD
jgi:hypothetical protein